MRWAPLTLLLLAGSGSAVRGAPPAAPEIWRDFPWPATATGTPVLVDSLALVAGKEWSLALSKLEAQLVDHPQDAGALHLAGLLFWQSGNREEATRRLIQAARSPDARPVTYWTLAALSEQANSQAEAVGWIKRATRGETPGEIEQWLRMPYFARLCEYPPYRGLLADLNLAQLCAATDIGFAGERKRTAEDDAQDLLGREGPRSSLRLPVQEAAPPLIRLEDEPGGNPRLP